MLIIRHGTNRWKRVNQALTSGAEIAHPWIFEAFSQLAAGQAFASELDQEGRNGHEVI